MPSRAASSMARLVCGAGPYHGETGEILAHVANGLESAISELEELLDAPSHRFSLIGPFLGRSVLELTATALIGRIDPFRLLVLRAMQGAPEYDAGVRHCASIQWQGDVMPDKQNVMWGPEKKYADISRALLGGYYETTLWRPAFTRFLDATVATPTTSQWIQDLRVIGLDDFMPRYRADCRRLYSALSKGIHHEFVVPPGALYDRPTVVSLLQDSLRVSAVLGCVVNLIGHAYNPMDASRAVVEVEQLQALEIK